MVSVSANVDAASAAAFQAALNGVSKSLGELSSIAPRVAALAVCDSLRHNTKKAPKRARSNEYDLKLSPVPPRYITTKRGILHRWQLTRKLGTPDEYTKQRYAYAHLRHSRKGTIVKDLAAERAEIRRYHLGIAHTGLANVSWNKAKQEIKGRSSSVVWKRRKNDRREPLKDVRGDFRKTLGATPGGVATIHNGLDYISDALKPNAMNEAMKSATLKIVYNKAFRDLRKGNMSIEDADRLAKQTSMTFRDEFFGR